ncbi:efflux RND transporter permease subunit [Pseudomaricurvus sp. HS19]|uniref:efflux RND transporter permease subunit n=1 Tax=Pseudomaricurvus sp. HS19 TaxID=2692626 RepID=UPI00136D98C9|nr:CusA/CzcA family heavy metal efflux RND transporter [Pseudomaricurvus sp. HS19]MYM61837.1 CusA/CzcA family heavy metal efflux RND transporter [Pseudomaricurvus sp. HS19]
MIRAIILQALDNRVLVMLGALALLCFGSWIVRQTPVDALPDLSDVQVIIKTDYAGQAPEVVEDQVTYPLTTAMLAVPGATNVRGISMYGTSYVYVLFEDGTDMYWARARVLEYLSQMPGRLPDGANPQLGPDATGVGWVFSYALIDSSGQRDLAQLRSLQDWYLKPQLQSVAGVSEVATVGGMVRQYQVVADPDKLRAYGVTLPQLRRLLKAANQESGASVIEMAEAEYMVRMGGYVSSVGQLKDLPLKVTAAGIPVLLSDVADVRLGPQMRRGIAELNGLGEVTGAMVVMRFGENASRVIADVKEKLAQLQAGLPAGVELVTTYDRSQLVHEAVFSLTSTLTLQLMIVVLICALFLWHFRSSLVVLVSLPLGVLGSFMLMYWQGLNANIMSLGGIAVAIGSMVDGSIVMLENAHKQLQRFQQREGRVANREEHWSLVREASLAVGPALCLSMLIEAVSFLPVLSLQAQEGRLFAPLAYTKSYAMVVAAGLTITLIPVLIGYWLKGPLQPETRNPCNRALHAIYRPMLRAVLARPWVTVAVSVLFLLLSVWPLRQLGSEFLGPLDEGDLMYMPTTQAAISTGEARRLLQITDKLIMSVPEVATVFGKIGRAETATDPAPLTMIETVIQFKPRAQWRPGMTPERLRQELDQRVRLPGVSNSWVMPIRTRIDMLATGIKTPLGLVLTGPELDELGRLGRRLEGLLSPLDGAVSVYAEQVSSSRYIRVDIDRLKAARYGLNIADIHDIAAVAIGGEDVTQTVEGLERYPVNLRYPRDYRDSLKKLRDLPLLTPQGQSITLADVAQVYVDDGPSMVRTENSRPAARVLIDVEGRSLGDFVAQAQQRIDSGLQLPPGYALEWSGQYQYMQRAAERLMLIVPMTLLLITVLLYLTFRRAFDVALALTIVPFALCGGVWLLWLLSFNLSVVVGVGFIALAGVTVGNGVMMMVYLNQALEAAVADTPLSTVIMEGAVQRVRPVMMTVITVLLGLLPAMLSTGTGSEVMQRIAAPMVGGIVSSMLMTLLVIPVVYLLWLRRRQAGEGLPVTS